MEKAGGEGRRKARDPAALHGHGGAGRAMGKRDGAAFFPSAAADGTLLARGFAAASAPSGAQRGRDLRASQKTPVFCDSIYRWQTEVG